ncbi:MAG: GTP cyclohydrolase I FolE [Muribaculaceae bacterium]|nr:GTP cyclohydrolase I FolE [Muribaculaceae bacterium]
MTDKQALSEQERIDSIASHIESIISLLGEDTSRQGLLKTPVRAAKALWFLTSGYRSDAHSTMSQAVFDHEGSQMIVVKDIEFYSMCEHHVLPFFGKISIGYIPDGKIVGLSKLARIVNIYARRLQVQERLTMQLCDQVRKSLGALGVIVVCEGEHMCMKMRGVEKQHSATTTMHYNGKFAEDPALRAEFLAAIRN